MENFTKIINPGQIKFSEVFVKIAFENKRLSITGVVGPRRNGDCRGSCGQIQDELCRITSMEPGWDRAKIQRLAEIWGEHHLNDMHAGCPHQKGPDWDTEKYLKLTSYNWGPKFHEYRTLALRGDLPITQEAWKDIVERVERITVAVVTPKHPALLTEGDHQLIADGFVKEGESETRTANWVYPAQHPEGFLTKPCPTCGHRYGSGWLFEEVPEDVLQWLHDLPETQTTPVWV